MGRPRKPDAIKILQGTDQPCRMNNAIQAPLESEVTAPKGLTGVAKRIYLDKANQLLALGMLSAMDTESLYLYATTLETAIKATKELKAKGHVVWIKDEDGNLIAQQVNVWFKILNDSIKIVNQIASQFGFTPVSRERLRATEQKESENPFDKFL